MKKLYVKDGEDIFVIAKLDPSGHDPALVSPAIIRGFRVIANSFGPTFELAPLQPLTLLSEVPNDNTTK